ncbi:MAG: DUF3343 domain-containing protein [Clostridia bacterium]|nr:DUF3343 domain-containing protein [Clostridia bacterium]
MRYIFSFRSRNAALRFRDDLYRNGVSCTLINTPQEAGVGCGLSVRIEASQLTAANRVLGIYPNAYYAGTFELNVNGYVVRQL